MTKRCVSAERVIETIAKGRSMPGNRPATIVYELSAASSCSGRGTKVVVNPNTRTVVTVIDKGSKFK